MTLEEELTRTLRTAGLAGRQWYAVVRRLGWDGRPPATLKTAGDAVGYTRERVRQLEERTLELLRQRRPELPLVVQAVAVVEAAAPAARVAVAELLADSGVTAQPFDVGGVLSAARVAGVTTDVVAERRSVLRREDVVLRPVVLRIARTLARRDGATTPADVAGLVGLPQAHVRLLLQDDVLWLDADWLVVEPLSGPVVGSLRKLLAVEDAPAIDSTLPPHVLAALVQLLEPAPLTHIERALVEIVRTERTTAAIRRRAAERGISAPSAATCLSRSPLFRRLEHGRWALAV